MTYDTLIENGWIADGISNQLAPGKIGIRDGRIGCVADRNAKMTARRVIDASDMIVAPGFIDVHSHSDQFLLLDPIMKNKLLQGITTEIGGNCGSSAFPWSSSNQFYIAGKDTEFDWRSFDEFLNRIQARGTALNYGSMLGHNCVRRSAGVADQETASRGQLATMKRTVAKAMEEGAFGLSSGMNLFPASIDTSNELVELTRVVARKGGLFSAHLRSESSDILNALSEAILVGIKSKVPLEISHFKVLDRMNWHKQEQALKLIHKMRAAGVNVSADFFPYAYVCAPLKVIFPTWVVSNGGTRLATVGSKGSLRERLEEHMSYSFPKKNAYRAVTVPSRSGKERGKPRTGNLCRIAEAEKTTPFSVLMDIALEEGLERFVYYECISKPNMEEIAKVGDSVVASDSFPTGIPIYFRKSVVHPRTFGAFIEFLRTFVYEKHLFSLPEAVRKLTSLPAKRYGIKQRGYIGAGACADITIFDPEKLDSLADVKSPSEYPKGVEYVLVNGESVIEKGEYTGKLPGMALRKNA